MTKGKDENIFEKRKDLLRRYNSYKKADAGAAYEKFLEATNAGPKKHYRARYLLYAAVILPFLLCLSYFLLLKPESTDVLDETENLAVVKPVANLTLHYPEGSEKRNTSEASASSKPINYKLENGVLDMRSVDNPSESDKNEESNENDKFELVTDRGDEFKLVLEDGTKIIMNYNSKLYYPVKFSKKQRTVRLYGEAYFEVSPDPERPFIVQLDNISVKQYGTAFNINTYNKSKPTITLVRGKISLTSDERSEEEVMLTPGDQAVYSEGIMNIKKVDTNRVTSWTRGLFAFEDERLDDIMKTLADWYELEVQINDPEVASQRLTGTFDRHQSIKNILNAIESVSGVKIKYHDGRIIVSGGNE